MNELISSACITGKSIADFENLHFKIASGLKNVLTRNFKKQATTAEGKAQSEKRSLTGTRLRGWSATSSKFVVKMKLSWTSEIYQKSNWRTRTCDIRRQEVWFLQIEVDGPKTFRTENQRFSLKSEKSRRGQTCNWSSHQRKSKKEKAKKTSREEGAHGGSRKANVHLEILAHSSMNQTGKAK